MFVFKAISYISLYAGIGFCALCLACGLYYISEVAEEHTILTRRILRVTTVVILVVHIILWVFEGFPLYATMVGFVSHLIYHQLSKSFPFITIRAWSSILSIICFVVSHVAWFYYFTSWESHLFGFFELLGFFFSCVWLVPAGYFVTLSVEDEMIIRDSDLLREGSGDILRRTGGGGKREKKNVLGWVMGWLKGLLGKRDLYE